MSIAPTASRPRTRLAAAVLSLGLSTTLTLSMTAPAQAAPGKSGAVTVVKGPKDGATVAIGKDVAFTLSIPKGGTARVDWGDGQSWQSPVCKPKAGRICMVIAIYDYPAGGDMVATVSGTGLKARKTTIRVGAPGDAAAADPANDALAQASWRQEMLAAVNEVRAKAGVPALRMCGPINVAAQDYAQLMAAKGHFDHTGPDGSSVRGRMTAAGFDGNAWGENIASGQPSVAIVMDGWVHSPGHYANLVKPDYTLVGFGRADSGKPYWVQDFGKGGRC